MKPNLFAPLLLALALPSVARADGASVPPGVRPVPVAAGFFLVNLNGVAERDESFDADLYLSLRWNDSRLAFEGDEPRVFLEDAATSRLDEMWWPQLEFVNTAGPEVTNRALEISPDGTVLYTLGVTSDFRADFDLRRFPFDRQTLVVRLQSFLWTADQMVFVTDPARIGFSHKSTFEGLEVVDAHAVVRTADLGGWGKRFSEFDASFEVERHYGFYVWTIFAPVALIFLISCAVFVVGIESFHDRVSISLTALLACIATQFAMAFNLPQISYLTIVDRVFLATYFCIALGVAIGAVEASLLRGNRRAVERIDRWAGFGLPTLFVLLIALSIARAGR